MGLTVRSEGGTGFVPDAGVPCGGRGAVAAGVFRGLSARSGPMARLGTEASTAPGTTVSSAVPGTAMSAAAGASLDGGPGLAVAASGCHAEACGPLGSTLGAAPAPALPGVLAMFVAACCEAGALLRKPASKLMDWSACGTLTGLPGAAAWAMAARNAGVPTSCFVGAGDGCGDAGAVTWLFPARRGAGRTGAVVVAAGGSGVCCGVSAAASAGPGLAGPGVGALLPGSAAGACSAGAGLAVVSLLACSGSGRGGRGSAARGRVPWGGPARAWLVARVPGGWAGAADCLARAWDTRCGMPTGGTGGASGVLARSGVAGGGIASARGGVGRRTAGLTVGVLSGLAATGAGPTGAPAYGACAVFDGGVAFGTIVVGGVGASCTVGGVAAPAGSGRMLGPAGAATCSGVVWGAPCEA